MSLSSSIYFSSFCQKLDYFQVFITFFLQALSSEPITAQFQKAMERPLFCVTLDEPLEAFTSLEEDGKFWNKHVEAVGAVVHPANNKTGV